MHRAMSHQTKTAYRKHQYAGPVNKKISRAALIRNNGPDIDKRSIAWRPDKPKQGKENRVGESSSGREVKTYKRKNQNSDGIAYHTHHKECQMTDKPDIYPDQLGANPPKPKRPCTEKENVAPPDPTVEDHKLLYSLGHKRDFGELVGYRIVDIKHLLDWALSLQMEHARVCTLSQVEYINEQRTGLLSTFTFKCLTCDKIWYKTSASDDKLNKSFVWGTLTAASHYAQTTQFLSTMDIPTMSPSCFSKIETELGKVWEEQLFLEMSQAAQQEREAAVANGHLCSDGVPYITVYVDGGWCKRTYGHNFNASSGIACIIGAVTKKCLFLGVRNKYCSMCAYNEKSGTEKEHLCFRNYQGSSTGMESDILVEGFSKSVEMHGLRYTSFVGDGDSSVFARLKDKVPYGNMIKKKECKNHVLKNYTSSLYKIAADTKLSLTARKILRAKLTKLTTVARLNIKQSNAEKMRADLKNGQLHVFGDHRQCDVYYCRWKEAEEKNTVLESDDNLVPIMKKDIVLWACIETAVDNIARKADRLISDVTNNVAENFMSLMAKFTCGKRIHLSRRGSYQRRAHIAGLCQISGQEWQKIALKRAMNRSPGPYVKKFIVKKARLAAHRVASLQKRIYKKQNKVPSRKDDKDYGPKADDPPPDLTNTELESLCQKKLDEFQIEDEKIKEIQLQTVGQHGNSLYDQLRKDRLTASQFGMICKRRPGTACHNHVKVVLYKNEFSNKDTKYGQSFEKVAIRLFEIQSKKTVVPAGLFIDKQHGFLGASPDGIVTDESSIVEVKTFPSLARSGMNLADAAQQKKNFCLKVSNGQFELKKSHNFYYQIQGQLHVTQMKKCYLILFISNSIPITVLEINRDDVFIESMLTKLEVFFKQCILPEIILRRIPNNLKCHPLDSMNSSSV